MSGGPIQGSGWGSTQNYSPDRFDATQNLDGEFQDGQLLPECGELSQQPGVSEFIQQHTWFPVVDAVDPLRAIRLWEAGKSHDATSETLGALCALYQSATPDTQMFVADYALRLLGVASADRLSTAVYFTDMLFPTAFDPLTVQEIDKNKAELDAQCVVGSSPTASPWLRQRASAACEKTDLLIVHDHLLRGEWPKAVAAAQSALLRPASVNRHDLEEFHDMAWLMSRRTDPRVPETPGRPMPVVLRNLLKMSSARDMLGDHTLELYSAIFTEFEKIANLKKTAVRNTLLEQIGVQGNLAVWVRGWSQELVELQVRAAQRPFVQIAAENLHEIAGVAQQMSRIWQHPHVASQFAKYAQDKYQRGLRGLAAAMININLHMATVAGAGGKADPKAAETYLLEVVKCLNLLMQVSTGTEKTYPVDTAPLTATQRQLVRSAQEQLIAIWGAEFPDNQQKMQAGLDLVKPAQQTERIGPAVMIDLLRTATTAEEMFAHAEQSFDSLTAAELTMVIYGASEYLEFLVDNVKTKAVEQHPTPAGKLLQAQVAGYKTLVAAASITLLKKYPTEYVGVNEAARAVYNKAKGDGGFDTALVVGRLVHQYIGSRPREEVGTSLLANVNRMLIWNLYEGGRAILRSAGRPNLSADDKTQLIEKAKGQFREAETLIGPTESMDDSDVFSVRDVAYAKGAVARQLHNTEEDRRIWVMVDQYGKSVEQICPDYRKLGPDDPQAATRLQMAKDAGETLAMVENRLGHEKKYEATTALYWGVFDSAILAYQTALAPTSWPDGAVQERTDTAAGYAAALVGKLCTSLEMAADKQCELAKNIYQTREMASPLWDPAKKSTMLANAERGIKYYCGADAVIAPPAKPKPIRTAAVTSQR